jgi:hypothetical protein
LRAGLLTRGDACRILTLDDRVFLTSKEAVPESLISDTWEVVKTFSASNEDLNGTQVPTLGDSTESGPCYTAYFVSAHSADPSIWYVSPPESGYSIDNLAPAQPGNLRMASRTNLAWDGCQAEDFKRFAVYGSTGPDPDPVLIGYTTEPTMDVSGQAYDRYMVTASDSAGNESGASHVASVCGDMDPRQSLPGAYALTQISPNPFGFRTAIAFALPEACELRLAVLDVRGRLVRTLTDEVWPAGYHSVTWSGENDVAEMAGSGIYFVLIEAGGFAATKRVLLAR